MESSLNNVSLILKGCRQNVWELLLHLGVDFERFFHFHVMWSSAGFSSLRTISWKKPVSFGCQSDAVLYSLAGGSSQHGHLFSESQQGNTSLSKTGVPILCVCMLI